MSHTEENHIIQLRAHEIPFMQKRLCQKTYINDDLQTTHGPEVASLDLVVIAKIKDDPDILIEIVDTFGALCHEKCLIRQQRWHHCDGDVIKKYEANEAQKLGLTIGNRIPAKLLFGL